jgi:hypothetical protein
MITFSAVKNEGDLVMKKLVSGLLFAFASFSAFAEPIIIKGIYLGMSKAEFDEFIPDITYRSWTVGGVKSKHVGSAATPKFEDGKLVSFLFWFDSSEYESVRNAVASKYPKLRCKNSTAQNHYGASFKNERCTLGTEFSIERYSSDIETSSLSMISNEELKKLEAELRSKLNDIRGARPLH